MTEYSGQHVAVLGFGIEGEPTVSYLLKHGATVGVIDDRPRKDFDEEIIVALEQRGVIFWFATNPPTQKFELIIRTPGAKPDHPLLVAAGKSGIKVSSATNIFLEKCPGIVIGVTGTKGKGTTCALIFDMLKNSQRKAFLGGNIGTPMLSFLDEVTPKSFVVLELSSFQLIDATRSPHLAVVLMVISEHLDYHADEPEYVAAKANITKYQTSKDFLIVNRDYPNSNAIAEQTKAQVVSISRQPVQGDGCFLENDNVIVQLQGKRTSLLPSSAIFLPGKHNLENACTAAMAAALLGVAAEHVMKTLKTFKGLEHRLEFVRELHGIKYYNDSFATTPESTIAAIRSFTAPLVLIIGGSTKHSDFRELGRVASEAPNIKAIIGIGQEWPTIKMGIPHLPQHVVEGATIMPEIVAAASKLAATGDIVLLSPACASFDMFRDYKERGRQYKMAVNKLT